MGYDNYHRPTKKVVPSFTGEESSNATNTNQPGDGSDSNQFLGNLRTLLLRIRMASQLRQDFVVEKHFVELKHLCLRICDELGTTAVFEDLWAVVRQRRGDTDNSHLPGRF